MGILTKWNALSRCTATDCLVRNDYIYIFGLCMEIKSCENRLSLL